MQLDLNDLVKELFPYEFRPYQKEILDTFTKTIGSNSHLVLEAGTGSGKTVCALAPALAYALKNKKKVLYLTRTNSQQQQVIYELREIAKKYAELQPDQLGIDEIPELLVVGLQGRQKLCPLLSQIPDLSGATAEELSKICTDLKRITIQILKSSGEGDASQYKFQTHVRFGERYSRKNGCGFFANVQNHEKDTIKTWAKSNLPTAEELMEYCKSNELCPYEVNKILLEDAVIVTAPYIYVFQQFIRNRLMEWLNTNLEDLVLIIDEAHNLPDYAREIGSAELSLYTLNKAIEESRKFKNPKLLTKIEVGFFCEHLKEIITDLVDQYLNEDDGFIPPNELETEIMSRFTLTSNKLKLLVNDLIIHGEIIQDQKRKRGKLPRSYIHSVGLFLLFWTSLESGEVDGIGISSDKYAKLIKNGDNSKIEAFCLDPAVVTNVINSFASSCSMSGTLKPLDEFKASIGLPAGSTVVVSYPSPFPLENRAIYYTTDVTTKYEIISSDKTVVDKMEDYIQNVCNNFDKNILIFFPSFGLMKQFLDDGVHEGLKNRFYIEQQSMKQNLLMDLVENFKLQENGTLFSVIGGRISEGLDFPAETLEIIIIAGVPYPKPTAKQRALEHYYDTKFGKGWDYTVNAPTTRKLLQSIGRLIRDENDRGVVLILDKRAHRFKEYIEGLKSSWNPIEDIQKFFKGG